MGLLERLSPRASSLPVGVAVGGVPGRFVDAVPGGARRGTLATGSQRPSLNHR